jgi:type IV secretory pathway VirB10-like protein
MNFSLFSKLFPKTQPVPNSPNVLGQTIKPHPDVQRVTHAPLIILLILVALIGGGVGLTAYSKAQGLQNASSDEAKPNTQLAETPDWFHKQQQEGVITSDPTQSNTPDLLSQHPGSDKTLIAQSSADLNTPSPVNSQPVPLTPYQEARLQQWQQHEQEKQQLEQQRHSTLQNALSADTTVFNARSNGTTLHGALKQQGQDEPNLASGQLDYSRPQTSNLNIPNEPPDTANYLMHTRVQAVSPFEVKAGTVIPSVMIGGVNSELPGQIIAQVSQSVYDTATGQYLLIPQGTKLVGTYDHQVVSGQKRVLVIWNRLIYPDASSVNLGGMTGADQAGYAGFTDKTNTHFWPTFRNALMLSAITAGVQLSQPRSQQGSYAYSSPQIAASALGQQMNQLGMNTISRGLNQGPTLTIRPGYVFNVMVNKDVILPPWQMAGRN